MDLAEEEKKHLDKVKAWEKHEADVKALLAQFDVDDEKAAKDLDQAGTTLKKANEQLAKYKVELKENNEKKEKLTEEKEALEKKHAEAGGGILSSYCSLKIMFSMIFLSILFSFQKNDFTSYSPQIRSISIPPPASWSSECADKNRGAKEESGRVKMEVQTKNLEINKAAKDIREQEKARIHMVETHAKELWGFGFCFARFELFFGCLSGRVPEGVVARERWRPIFHFSALKNFLEGIRAASLSARIIFGDARHFFSEVERFPADDSVSRRACVCVPCRLSAHAMTPDSQASYPDQKFHFWH